MFSQEKEDEYFNENYLRYDNHTYKESINTVQLYREGYPLSYPIIELISDDALKMSFDDLDTDVKDYSYTIIHCNASWEPTDLQPMEYIIGFNEIADIQYKYSFNTLVHYVNYSFSFPNQDMRPKISGNYILYVFEDFDREKPVITRRFSVLESKVSINGKVKQPDDFNVKETHHEVDFTIDYTGLKIYDPYSEIKVAILQNNRPDNAITNLQPLYVKDQILEYDYDDKNLFSGGNEFRNFDIKSIRYQSEFINSVVLTDSIYNVQLKQGFTRSFAPHYTDFDINGKCFVYKQEGIDQDVEPDYVYVWFELPYEAPFVDGNLYVYGGISDWKFGEKNRMVYNFDKNAYQLKMLLKQGYYNYQYVFLKDGDKGGDEALIEGSHYQTENDYMIYVYYHGTTSRYDKLVGFKIFNSIRQGGVEMESPFKNLQIKLDNFYRN